MIEGPSVRSEMSYARLVTLTSLAMTRMTFRCLRRSSAAVLILASPACFADCPAGHKIAVGASRIELSFRNDAYSLSPAQICGWATKAAEAVAHYFGRFPVAEMKIVLEAADGDEVSGGTTYGQPGGGRPLIVIRLGRFAGQSTLDRDWVMTHEMVHLSVPEVPDSSHWLEEGIATYVEPIARAQLGQLGNERVWGDMFSDMPKGTPGQHDHGLDHTPTWGRTYWGGALFCLLADVEIRKRTENHKGLADALRGVLAAGGSIEHDWPVTRFIEVADKAVGVPVLSELYERMKDAPGPGQAELDALWKQLGVSAVGGQVRFDDKAPLAAIRRAISAG